jgi:hypothetical protein
LVWLTPTLAAVLGVEAPAATATVAPTATMMVSATTVRRVNSDLVSPEQERPGLPAKTTCRTESFHRQARAQRTPNN